MMSAYGMALGYACAEDKMETTGFSSLCRQSAHRIHKKTVLSMLFFVPSFTTNNQQIVFVMVQSRPREVFELKKTGLFVDGPSRVALDLPGLFSLCAP